MARLDVLAFTHFKFQLHYDAEKRHKRENWLDFEGSKSKHYRLVFKISKENLLIVHHKSFHYKNNKSTPDSHQYINIQIRSANFSLTISHVEKIYHHLTYSLFIAKLSVVQCSFLLQILKSCCVIYRNTAQSQRQKKYSVSPYVSYVNRKIWVC